MSLPKDEHGREYVTRYVVTFIDKDGYRRMIGPRQGRCTYATEQEAEDHLQATLANNTAAVLASVYGDASRMAVKPCQCYPIHFDPMTYYFEPEVPPAAGLPQKLKT